MPIAPDRFEVARNCRDRYLQDLGLLLRASGMLGEMSSQAILDGVGRHYDQMVERTSRGGFSEEAHGLTASRITLVGDDELELGIRLDNLTGRLFEGAVTDLWHTYLRFITLLGRPDLQKADNPVGPRGISAGLREMFKALGARSLDEQLDLVDRLEELLLSGLPEIYRDLNGFLENASIAAAQASIVGTPDSPQKTTASSDVGQEAIVALQEGLLARSSDLAPALGSSNADIGVALLSQAALDNLMFRLDNLERTSSSQDDFLTSSSPDLASLLPGLFEDHQAKPQPATRPLTARELGVPSATPEGLAIDSVAMLYEAIQADPKLADSLKALIAGLQIILVKMAIKDRSLFTDANHPCRRVIDGMELALMGAPLDIPAQHPLCARLTAIANELRSVSVGDRSAFEQAARQIDAIIGERNAEIDSQAAAYVTLFTWLERRDQALINIDQLFQNLAIERLPTEIFQFIERHWRPILEQTWLKEGPDSASWRAQTTAIHTLLGGFQVTPEGEERLPAGSLAEALQTLNVLMERVKLPANERTRLLDLCFARQRDALRRSSVPETTEPAVPNRWQSQRVATGTLKAGKLTLHTLDFTQPHKLAMREPGCLPGDWLELTVAGERQVLRLCRQSPDSGRSLLFNPDLPLALSIHPQLLDLQLRAGEASRLGEPGLFEAAAIEALRESRR